jgi:hypothetical protein
LKVACYRHGIADIISSNHKCNLFLP